MKYPLNVVNNFRDAYQLNAPYKLPGPKTVLLQVNYGCYLKCVMCNKHKWNKEGAYEKNTLTTDELIKLFHDLKSLDAKRVMLTGTEPVMRKDINLILKGIYDAGLKAEIYVAGIKLKDSVIKSILDYSVDVAFSVDGFYSESHNKIRLPDNKFDVFKTTLESIHKLNERRTIRNISQSEVSIMANFTVQRDNINDLKTATNKEIDALGVDFIRMNLVHGLGKYSLDENDLKILIDFAKRLPNLNLNSEINLASDFKYLVNGRINPSDFKKGLHIPSDVLNGSLKIRCHRGEYSTMIDPEGNVRGCQYLYDDNGFFNNSTRDKFILGSIRDKSIIDIWNSDEYLNFRTGVFPDLTNGSRCRSCEYMGAFEEIENKSKNKFTE